MGRKKAQLATTAVHLGKQEPPIKGGGRKAVVMLEDWASGAKNSGEVEMSLNIKGRGCLMLQGLNPPLVLQKGPWERR